jgi:hypothetical protein
MCSKWLRRERETQRDTERDTKTHRETPKHIETHREASRNRDTSRSTETHRDTPRHTETHRETPRHIETHRDTSRHIETSRNNAGCQYRMPVGVDGAADSAADSAADDRVLPQTYQLAHSVLAIASIVSLRSRTVDNKTFAKLLAAPNIKMSDNLHTPLPV